MTPHTEDSRNGRRRLSEIVEAVVPFAVDERSPKVEAQQEPAADTTPAFATRTGVNALAGVSKNKLLLLGGGLAIAVLFFIFTALVGRSPKRQMAAKTPSQQGKQGMTQPTKGSVTPLMETVRNPAPDNSAGQLGPNDIRRTRSSEAKMPPSTNAPMPANPIPAKQIPAPSLASVPSFADTQQRWEEPRPYGTTATAPTPSPQSQLQSSLKEPSLIFVRSEIQNRVASALEGGSGASDMPPLNMTPGSRIQAKLQTQVSSAVQAPVVAIVEYTYAVGDRVIVPAGARVYGELQQVDPSGLVSVKFDEIELLDGAREKIDAIGTSLELGPIKGEVTGKNTLEFPTLPKWALPHQLQSEGRQDHPETGAQTTATQRGPVDQNATAKIEGFRRLLGDRIHGEILRRVARTENADQIPNAQLQMSVMNVMERATRGVHRANALAETVGGAAFIAVLDSLQIGSMTTIASLEALKRLVFELERMEEQQAA